MALFKCTYIDFKPYKIFESRTYFFLHIFHSYIFQIIRQILISDKGNLSKLKIQFLNNDFIY